MSWLLTLALAATPFPCGSLDQAILLAQQGSLFPAQRVCLDEVAGAPGDYRLTASHLLLNDATMRGSHATWKRLAERHLTTIDPDDPALVLAYARYLFVAERAEATLSFTGQMLERAAAWGDVGEEVVLALHRMRAVTAIQRWQSGAGDRAVAHAYTVAWARAAEASGRRDGTALGLCALTGPAGDCPTPTVAEAD